MWSSSFHCLSHISYLLSLCHPPKSVKLSEPSHVVKRIVSVMRCKTKNLKRNLSNKLKINSRMDEKKNYFWWWIYKSFFVRNMKLPCDDDELNIFAIFWVLICVWKNVCLNRNVRPRRGVRWSDVLHPSTLLSFMYICAPHTQQPLSIFLTAVNDKVKELSH